MRGFWLANVQAYIRKPFASFSSRLTWNPRVEVTLESGFHRLLTTIRWIRQQSQHCFAENNKSSESQTTPPTLHWFRSRLGSPWRATFAGFDVGKGRLQMAREQPPNGLCFSLLMTIVLIRKVAASKAITCDNSSKDSHHRCFRLSSVPSVRALVDGDHVHVLQGFLLRPRCLGLHHCFRYLLWPMFCQ